MIKFSAENKNALTPGFVSTALESITHRFLLIMECETRKTNDVDGVPVVTPPRFAIGGTRATLDPRTCRVAELMPLAKYKLELPEGWEKLHNYIYVLQASTDEHGWQYRSCWSDGPLREEDEQWARANAPGLDVRRRLWMTTVVGADQLAASKKILSDALRNRMRGVIMEGELFRQEQGALMKSWQKRSVVLSDDCIEVYSGGARDAGGKKIAELSILDCDAKMLFGIQCPGRDFAFSIRKANGSLVALFDAENREIRRRWVVAIRYQLALLSNDVNFPAFDYGPPISSEEPVGRVLMCGELQKQGHMVRNWKNRFFQLTTNEVQYYDRETLKGTFPIRDAALISDEKSLDFTLRSPKGKILIMRADTMGNKNTWVRVLNKQIQAFGEKDEEEAKAAEDEAATTSTVTAAPTGSAAAASAGHESEEEDAVDVSIGHEEGSSSSTPHELSLEEAQDHPSHEHQQEHENEHHHEHEHEHEHEHQHSELCEHSGHHDEVPQVESLHIESSAEHEHQHEHQHQHSDACEHDHHNEATEHNHEHQHNHAATVVVADDEGLDDHHQHSHSLESAPAEAASSEHVSAADVPPPPPSPSSSTGVTKPHNYVPGLNKPSIPKTAEKFPDKAAVLRPTITNREAAISHDEDEEDVEGEIGALGLPPSKANRLTALQEKVKSRRSTVTQEIYKWESKAVLDEAKK